MIQIWNDTRYDFPTDKFFYTVEKDGEAVYQGKAYKFPDSDSGSVLVNKVCQNYLSVDICDLSAVSGSTTYVHTGLTGTFVLKSGTTTLQTYQFVNDWNYDNLDYSVNQSLNFDINGHRCTNQLTFSTTYNATSGKVISVIDKVNSGLYCGPFALYYTNRRNGWDSFLIEGKVREKDSYQSYEYEGYVRTERRSVDREVKRYKNVITKSYELNTNWLTDGQSKVLARHLLSSNNVYLHNLATGEIMPVSITDNEVDYKVFDRKMVSYTINVKVSNNEELQ